MVLKKYNWVRGERIVASLSRAQEQNPNTLRNAMQHTPDRLLVLIKLGIKLSINLRDRLQILLAPPLHTHQQYISLVLR